MFSRSLTLDASQQSISIVNITRYCELALHTLGQYPWQKGEAHLQGSERQILQGSWEGASHVPG